MESRNANQKERAALGLNEDLGTNARQQIAANKIQYVNPNGLLSKAEEVAVASCKSVQRVLRPVEGNTV